MSSFRVVFRKLTILLLSLLLPLFQRGVSSKDTTNYFGNIGIRPSIYGQRWDERSDDYTNPSEDSTVPEHLWRLLIARNARVVVPIDRSFWERDISGDSGFSTTNLDNEYHAMKRRVLSRHVYGDAPIRGRFSENFDRVDGTRSPRVYLAVDRYAAADALRKDFSDNAETSTNDFESVHCDGDNDSIVLHEMTSLELIKSVVERMVDDSFAHWRRSLRHDFSEKLRASEHVPRIRKKIGLATDGDVALIHVVLHHLETNVAATCDETGVRLNDDVDWFVRWNELSDDVRRNTLDSLQKTYYGYHVSEPSKNENVTLGPGRAIRLNRSLEESPTSSVLYIAYSDNPNRPVVSLWDTMLSLMGDYTGAIVANDKGTARFVEPLCTFRSENGNLFEAIPPDRQAIVATTTAWKEHARRIAFLFSAWSRGDYRARLDDIVSALASSKRRNDVRALLGETIVDLGVAVDLVKSLLLVA